MEVETSVSDSEEKNGMKRLLSYSRPLPTKVARAPQGGEEGQQGGDVGQDEKPRNFHIHMLLK